MDRCHHRGPDQPREGERYEIGLVVNKVELTGPLKDMGDVEHLPHLCVDRGIFGIGRRANAIQPGCRPAIQCGEQGDVDTARHQRLGQEARHLLPRPVMARRCTPGDRRQHGNAQTTILLCSVLSSSQGRHPRSTVAGAHRLRPAPHRRQWTGATGCRAPNPATASPRGRSPRLSATIRRSESCRRS